MHCNRKVNDTRHFNVLRSTPTPWGHAQIMNVLDQIKKYKHNLIYTKKNSLFTLATIVFMVMLLTILRAPLVLLDSLTLELPSKLLSTFSESYMFDMLSSSSRRTLNKWFFFSKNTYTLIGDIIVLTQGTLTFKS